MRVMIVFVLMLWSEGFPSYMVEVIKIAIDICRWYREINLYITRSKWVESFFLNLVP